MPVAQLHIISDKQHPSQAEHEKREGIDKYLRGVEAI